MTDMKKDGLSAFLRALTELCRSHRVKLNHYRMEIVDVSYLPDGITYPDGAYTVKECPPGVWEVDDDAPQYVGDLKWERSGS